MAAAQRGGGKEEGREGDDGARRERGREGGKEMATPGGGGWLWANLHCGGSQNSDRTSHAGEKRGGRKGGRQPPAPTLASTFDLGGWGGGGKEGEEKKLEPIAAVVNNSDDRPPSRRESRCLHQIPHTSPLAALHRLSSSEFLLRLATGGREPARKT
ncbi:hypothetical protein TIFTF001_002612 [Ficus carica]|uniref:Uncharacterized protein n=1 Tax=Ficus carica TaxID=3494 RepID=A0AA87Z5P1_FICCA|nr:hypothetical protein TIFTF001_002612 [Ficus carica]